MNWSSAATGSRVSLCLKGIKAIAGTTTIDEVLRITKGDHDLAELEKMTRGRATKTVAG